MDIIAHSAKLLQPNNKNELKKAIDLWCKNKDEAIQTYGDISNWDVSNVISMP